MDALSEATSGVGLRANVLGVGIDPLDLDRAVDRAIAWTEAPIGRARYACFCTVNTVMECQENPRFRTVVNAADLAAPDGMPLVWLARHQGFPETSRVYGPDFLLRFFERTGPRYRHFFYGGAPGVADELARRLGQRYGRLETAGTLSPPFGTLTADQDAAIVATINAAAPDVIWVGLSTPKQDYWAASHAGQLNAKLIFAVGAAFDFHSGRVKQAPLWMQCHGLEWLFRLIQEPRRLWRRYLLYNPRFLASVLLQLVGARRYALPERREF
ncbi:MAG TPA: WecB/TagA/CpsF family glycosyltransferase [Chloroflexota bacterium]|nr:WecB/TagA/CpsF family glycosyltransferase [Chloroflexota bacterium]